jgi:uncharacterized protein YebE (UPF0316 family)
MSLASIGIYVLMLVMKVVEVSIGTLRIVLITRGERVLGAFLGFIEVLLWIILVSTVLKDVSSDPVKVVVYAAGFALGNYAGSFIEEKLGIGNVRVEAIVLEEDGKALAGQIRDKGYAVTVMEGQGMNYKRNVLLMNIRRKDCESVVSLIKNLQQNVVITMNDIKPVYGGFGVLKR